MSGNYIIVSRHTAAIEFIRSAGPEWINAPVMAQATPADVRGNIVAGNLPLQLAALAAEVVAVEFVGDPPRGLEYSVADMQAAGVRLARYRVAAIADASAPETWESISLSAARKAAQGKTGRPLVEVVASHSAHLPAGFDPEAPTVLLDGGTNNKRPLYLVDGRSIAVGTHYGLESGFRVLVGGPTYTDPCGARISPDVAFEPIAKRLLPAVEYLRAKARIERQPR